MTKNKFKIGDRVKLLTTKGDYTQDSIGRVTYFWHDGKISVKFDKRESLVCLPEDIERVNEEKEVNNA